MIDETPAAHKDNKENVEGEIEKRRKEAEVKIRESEARLGETEVSLREKELNSQPGAAPSNWKTTVSSLSAPFFLALVALAGTAIGSVITGVLNIRLEKEKFRSAIIQKATESGSPEEKARSLKFLAQTEIIDDPSGKIIYYSEHPAEIPTLLPLDTTQQGAIVGDGWIFIGTFVNEKWSKKTIRIPDKKLPENGETYSIIDDVYLRNDRPTKDNQTSSIVKTVFAGASVQILERYQVPGTEIFWCKVTLNTSGASNNGGTPSSTSSEPVKNKNS